MTVFSFYDSHGDFVGGTFSGPDTAIGANTPVGCGAIEGVYDATRQRVAVADDGFGNAHLVVVTRKPPKPANTDLVAWDWDEVADEWVARPTLQARRAALRSARNESLSASDGPAIAAIEELLKELAARLSLPIPASAQSLLVLRKTLRDLPQRPDFDLLTEVDVPRYQADGSGSV